MVKGDMEDGFYGQLFPEIGEVLRVVQRVMGVRSIG